jgi:hypothetical protein
MISLLTKRENISSFQALLEEVEQIPYEGNGEKNWQKRIRK